MTLDMFQTEAERSHIELRDYQQKDLEAVQRAAEESHHRKIIYQLPTGGGKTIWAVQYAVEHIENIPFARVVVLSHRDEVQTQIRKDFKKYAPHIIPEIRSPMKLYNMFNKGIEYWNYSAYDLMIVDEAHHSPAKSWETPIKEFPGQVVGLTATPWRLSKVEGFDHIWQYLHCGPDIVWLTDNGHLCPLKIKTPPSRETITGRGHGTGGDYSMSQTYDYLNQHKHINIHAIEWLLRHTGPDRNKKSIVFCLTVEHAHATAETLTQKGYPARAIDAKTPLGERRRIIADFKDGDLHCLCNVFIASEGFDLPTAEIVAMFRPTKSLAMYLQMLGRGTRTAEGKEFGTILDAAQNATVHGHPYEPRIWSLKPRGKKEPGTPPSKRCDYCRDVSPGGARKCYGCGHPFGKECDGCKAWRSWKWYPTPEEDCYDCQSNSRRYFDSADEDKPNGGTFNDPKATRGKTQPDRSAHRTLLNAGFRHCKSGSYQKNYAHFIITIMESKRHDDKFGYIIRSKKTNNTTSKWIYNTPLVAMYGAFFRMNPEGTRKQLQHVHESHKKGYDQ